MDRLLLIAGLGAVAVTATWVAWSSWFARRATLERLDEPGDGSWPIVRGRRRERGLTPWLGRAGFTDAAAPSWFIGTTAVAIALGGLGALGLGSRAVQTWFAVGLTNVPAGLRDSLLGASRLGPWLLVGLLGAIPWLVVRGRRRRLVQSVEEDLPITLDLLATLAEAGLGLDAGLQRILRTARSDHPLTIELRRFQQEQLAGIPRVQALRNVARRLDVGSLTVFVSAVVQAEQVGASLTETLRRQAEDLRDRRRQRALTLAQSLPVKLVFPLVICFLPGIFVSVLGPALYQMAQLAIGTFRATP